jgi:hypothetical protein
MLRSYLHLEDSQKLNSNATKKENVDATRMNYNKSLMITTQCINKLFYFKALKGEGIPSHTINENSNDG